MVSSANTGKAFLAPSTVTPPRMYPVSARSSFTGEFNFAITGCCGKSFEIKLSVGGNHGKHRPWRSPRASRVLNTCSGAIPIWLPRFRRRSSGSTWYSRSSYCTPRFSSNRTASVFTAIVAALQTALHFIHAKSYLRSGQRTRRVGGLALNVVEFAPANEAFHQTNPWHHQNRNGDFMNLCRDPSLDQWARQRRQASAQALEISTLRKIIHAAIDLDALGLAIFHPTVVAIALSIGTWNLYAGIMPRLA